MRLATPELVLRSLGATWTYARWEAIPTTAIAMR
jgi:hypothetical protein